MTHETSAVGGRRSAVDPAPWLPPSGGRVHTTPWLPPSGGSGQATGASFQLKPEATGRQRRSDARGFTLIELLVVLSLISVLAAMGMVQHRNSVLKAQEATLVTDLFHMRDAIDQYYADKGKYPATLDSLVSDGYLRKIPEDPITKTADSWQTVPAEPDPSSPTAEPGIYDVKSGAQGTSLDGKAYADL